MNVNIKKASAAVLAFFGIGALTACYGMPPQEDDDNNFLLNGKVSTLDDKGETTYVAHVRVVLNTGSNTYVAETDDKGYYQLDVAELPHTYSLIFEDMYGKLQSDTADVINTHRDKLQTLNITLKTK